MKDYWNNRARALPWGSDPTWFEVPLGRQSWAIPELRTATGASVEGGPQCSVTFHTSDAGVRVVAFTLEDPFGAGLTGKRLRTVKYAECIRIAFENAAVPLGADGLPATGFFGVNGSELAPAIDPTRRQRGRPSSIGGDEYERAASLYRQAQEQGRPTTAAVADGLGVSASTARKRIMGARGRGLLPPAESTRPRVAP